MVHKVVVIVIGATPDGSHVVSATEILATGITVLSIMAVRTVAVINVADRVLPCVSWATVVAVATGVFF